MAYTNDKTIAFLPNVENNNILCMINKTIETPTRSLNNLGFIINGALPHASGYFLCKLKDAATGNSAINRDIPEPNTPIVSSESPVIIGITPII